MHQEATIPIVVLTLDFLSQVCARMLQTWTNLLCRPTSFQVVSLFISLSCAVSMPAPIALSRQSSATIQSAEVPSAPSDICIPLRNLSLGVIPQRSIATIAISFIQRCGDFHRDRLDSVSLASSFVVGREGAFPGVGLLAA